MAEAVKIVYVITGINIGGAERLLLDTVRALDRERFLPVVVALVGGDLTPEFQRAGIRVINIGMSRRWPLAGALRLLRTLRAERPDILHTHLIHADILGRVLGRLRRVPVIVTTLHMVEDARRKFPYLALNRFAARLTSAFIAVSESAKRELVHLERLDPAKVTVIRNAVKDIEKPDARSVGDIRERLKLQDNTLVLGIVSRLEAPRKGHHVLFAALAQLVERYPQLHCIVVGDGAARRQLEDHVRRLNLEGHVTFVGTQKNIPAWLSVIDIFVLPSLLEGFPMAVIEAMAAGRPVIATRVGGVSELIEHRKDGWLINPGSIDELIEALETLIPDPGLRFSLGHAARERFEKEFEIRGAVEATERLYARLLQSAGISRRLHLMEVLTNFTPGGVPSHVFDLVTGLSKDKFKIEFVSGETNADLIPHLGIPHHYVELVKPVRLAQDLRAVLQMVRLFKKLKPDIVHAHMGKGVCLASIAGRLAGVPCVLGTIHGQTFFNYGFSFKQFMFDAVEWIALRFFSHGTISVSRETARHLNHSGKVPRSRSVVIYNGVHPLPSVVIGREEVRRKLGIGASDLVVLMTGRLAFPKTPEVVIEACSLLRERFPNLVCLFAGDGPKRRALEDLVHAFELAGHAHLLGHRNDIPDLLRAADVLVLSSIHEGQSIAVLEGMMASLPVVASRVPGMDEVVLDGITGHLFRENSSRSCAEALAALLADPHQRRVMGEAGNRRAQQYFTFARELAQTEALLLACGRKGFPENYKLKSPPPERREQMVIRGEKAIA